MNECCQKIKWIIGWWLFFSGDWLFGQEPVLILPVGHTSSVSTSAYSPDGRYIVTASWDNTAKIWDASEGRLLSELKGHTGSLTSAIFSADGKYIVTTSKDSTARIWETSTGHFVYELKGHADWVSSACFSKDGRYLVTASWDNTAKVWNMATGKLMRTLTGHSGPLNAISFNKDGKYVLTASKDSTAKLWRTSDGHVLKNIKGHADWVTAAVFSPDGKYILTASKDNTAAIWEISTGLLLNKFTGHSGGVNTALFSPNGRYIVTSSKDSTARIWQTSNAHLLYDLKGHRDAVNTALFSSDGRYVVTGSRDNEAMIWQTSNGQLYKELKGHTGPVNTVAFRPGDEYILTASDDNTAKQWRTADGHLSTELKGHTSVLNSAIISPDGKYFVTASWDNSGKIWNTGDVKLRGNLKGHEDWVNAVAFSPDGRYVATASSDNTARLWEVPNGNLIFELKGHTDWVSSVAYSPDGNYVVTTSWDNTAKIWNATNGKLIADMKGHTGIVRSANFSRDGKYIVTASWDNTAKIWSAENGKLIQDLRGHTDKIRTAVFSPDGKYVLTASWDSTAKIWDGSDGDLICELQGHRGSLNSAAFSPDGKHIVTTSMDSTAKIWLAAGGKLVHDLKAHTNAVISSLYSPDGKYLVTASWDNTAMIWEAETGKLLTKLEGHTASLKSAAWSPDGKYIITTSEDNTLKRWNALTGKFLYTFFTVDSTDYLAIDKDGHYDGTEAARKMLYYVCNNEIVDLEQFKDLSWEPGLVSKLTGVNKEPITAKKISEVNLCNYTPVVEERGFRDGNYLYQITPKRGGIGEVQLYVNGKLVQRYSASHLQKINNVYKLSVRKESIVDFFVPGQYNQVVVKATTSGGTMVSRGAALTIASDRKPVTNPDMYIIAVGVSKYKGERLQLKYASKDAIDFTSALATSARKLLNSNGQHVYSYVFSTEDGSRRWPVKTGLQRLIDTIAQKARPEDILVIFFAGHGVLLSGQKNFFLLTAEASTLELNGVENEVSISTEELKEWFRKIKANKQILILDACNSGQVVQKLQELIIKRDMPSDQQRALESLKDKTGTFILSASAAGQSAYETSLYGQGLLTYSLLSGIKLGGALRDNKFLDVTRWFNFAADYVKVLAKEIGGRQDPQIIGNASFVIGLVDKEVIDSIRISIKKKIFSRSKFIQDEELLNDDLDLSSLVDKELISLSERGRESPLVFAADNTLPDNYSIRGKYSVMNDTISARISVFKGQKERVSRFDLTGTNDKKDVLIQRIVEKVREYLKQ